MLNVPSALIHHRENPTPFPLALTSQISGRRETLDDGSVAWLGGAQVQLNSPVSGLVTAWVGTSAAARAVVWRGKSEMVSD